MPEDEILTPEGTEDGIETLEAPAIEPVIEDEPAPVSQADIDAIKAEKEAAERRHAESTRENQILAAKLKKFEETQINNQPTEDDYRKAIAGFDEMVPNEQRLAIQGYNLERKLAAIEAKENAREAENSWNREIETFVLSEPKLHGQEDKFRQFANKKTHRGAPLDVLKSAFFYETPVTQPTQRTPGLEPGSGGPRDVAKKSLSGTDLQQLRTTNYEAYKEYVNTHEIDI